MKLMKLGRIALTAQAEAADQTPVVEDMDVPAEISRREARLAALTEALGTATDLLADTGYFSQANVQACIGSNNQPSLEVAREWRLATLAWNVKRMNVLRMAVWSPFPVLCTA